MVYLKQSLASVSLVAMIALFPAQAANGQDAASQIIPMVCRGEIWVRDGQLPTKRLVQHSYLTIEVTLDKTEGVLRVQSPSPIYGVHGGDQVIVDETPGRYYFITPRDRDIDEQAGIQVSGSTVLWNSYLDRTNGDLVLMEGRTMADGMSSSFSGNCERVVQRF